MKKLILFISILILILVGIHLFPSKISNTQEQEAKSVVLDFGEKLKMVSILAPKKTVVKDIQDNYSGYVSPDLLNQWESDPSKAPGRITSSPWPDRIEIASVAKQGNDSYKIEGKVIEITSVEAEKGGVANSYVVNIEVQKIGNKWLITEFEKIK